MLHHIFFDFDGTVTDSAEGIVEGVRVIAKKLGLPELEREALLTFVGPPMYDSLIRWYGLSPEQSAEGVKLYREYYGTEGYLRNSLYPGVPELLNTLKEQGRELYIATLKPQPFLEKVIDLLGLQGVFRDALGVAVGEGDEKITKTDILRTLMEKYGVDPSDAVMAGDRENDMIAARETGMKAAGVTWGCGTVTELLTAGAESLCQNPGALQTAIEWWDTHPNPGSMSI